MNSRNEFKPGDIVTSVSGRDKNRYYIVMSAGERIVEICDGDLHKVDKIKKKNVKHIKNVGSFSEIIGEKILKGEKISDSEIRKILSAFK